MRLRFAAGLFVLRRLVRELSGIREQLTRQTDLLARLADQLAPPIITADPTVVQASTGVDHVDAADLALVQAYVDRTQHDTGHAPTDDEILDYLADEKTRDLHTRMIERDEALERLRRGTP